MIPTVKSYFSGAGGMDLGLLNAGIDIVQSLEIDPTCIETLSLNFKHKIISADIKDRTVLDQPKTDIVVGTYPCTKYSAIADIHGTRTGEDLFLHFFRHVALEKPEAYVIENVPGMRKFKVVMECFTKLPDYYVNVICPVDAINWLPQRRERLIIIGTRKPFNISAPSQQRRIKLKDIIEQDPQIDVPNYVYSRMNGKWRDLPIISDPEDDNAVAPTCVAHYSKDLSTRLLKDKRFKMGVRPYTVREWARLQGFPDDFQFAGSPNQIYKQVGNAVAEPVGRWIGVQMNNYFNN
jgi:DNA (cytosine-5)-methyltransferase 1